MAAAVNIDLQRFLDAHDGKSNYDATYAGAIKELRLGKKDSCWIWFIFPQMLSSKGKTKPSGTSREYELRSTTEAVAYLEHSVLGPRYVECSEAVLAFIDNFCTKAKDEVIEVQSMAQTTGEDASGEKTKLLSTSSTALLSLFGWDVDVFKFYQSLSTMALATLAILKCEAEKKTLNKKSAPRPSQSTAVSHPLVNVLEKVFLPLLQSCSQWVAETQQQEEDGQAEHALSSPQKLSEQERKVYAVVHPKIFQKWNRVG